MSNIRRVQEGDQVQGVNEKIAYQFDTTPWGGSPVISSSKLWDISAATEVDASSASLSGSASVATNTITTPIVQALTKGHKYRLEIKWTKSGLTLEIPIFITAEA